MKNKITSISFCLLLLGFFILNVIVKDKEISQTERRYLETLPEFKIDNIMDKTYMKKLEKYTLDQFLTRDKFRSIKANINYNVLFQLDNNGIYVKDNHIFKKENTTNIKSINNFTNKINNIINNLSERNNIYYSIIPDKNYYLKDDLFINIDYDYLFDTVQSNLNINYIEIRDLLDLNDYYETDTHWKQENLIDVAKRLSGGMKSEMINQEYERVVHDNFYGVYYGQYALSRKPERITYLTNKYTDNAIVNYYENKNINSVYNFDKLNSFDKYEIFLDGASSFIEITNPIANTEKELVIFRDSFGSSIAPLLISSYSKITLIDTRYISSTNLDNLIDFTDQDLLFLYSTLIITNSNTLKE